MKKTSRNQLQPLRRRRLALALVGAMAMPMMPALAQNQPTGGTVVNGSASINESGFTTTITQTTKGAIIDWGSFNIGSGYGVTFDQQFGTSSVTLNRVVGAPGASQINGTLSANGNVFIVNPAGITFGNGAQVNVGGLVASALWINSGDFINGLTTGQYVFSGFNGDPSATHQVRNNTTINAGAGGVGLVGQTVWNSGSITSNGGNIVAGAGTQVTLDMVGDGLTQVTINLPPTVDSAVIQDRNGSMIADGGKILLRTAATAGGTGGGIFASGTLRAQSIANINGRIELTSAGGGVMVGAPGIFSDAGTPFTQGAIDVSGGAGETGGSVLIQGNGVIMVNDDATPANPTTPLLSIGSSINATGVAGGGQVDIQSSAGVSMLGLSRITADANLGIGGQVRIAAVGAVDIRGDINAASNNSNGGNVGLLSTTGNVLVFGTVSASGANNGGAVSISAANGGLAIDGSVSANGGGNGGQVTGVANTVVLTENSQVNVNGAAGAGGVIGFRGTNALAAYGLLSARGNTAGGSIVTATDGTFDIRGLWVNAGSNTGAAGSWLLSAPSLSVVNGAVVGGVGAPVLGNSVQDAEINYAFLTGTSVVLQSGADVQFDGAQLVANNAVPLTFAVNAQGGIFGNAFSITSSSGPLDMVFNANASSLNTGFAGINFTNATLDSNGGDIAMYGQSDPIAGTASSFDSGIELDAITIRTAGGNVLMRGSSTGADPGPNAAGVSMNAADIDAGGGAIDIFGFGAGATSGVIALGSQLTSGGGNVTIEGDGGTIDGVRLEDTAVSSNGGDLSITGTGGAYGVYATYGYAVLQSGGGDIIVRGDGGTAAGTFLTGAIDSAGGNIDVYGYSSAAEGLVLNGGYVGGVTSAGGDIRLEGNGVTGGALLYGGGSGTDSIDSAGGPITIIGTASATDAIGVLLSDLAVVGGSGDVFIDGMSPAGIGILFQNGASVSTTTGAIGLYGTGADFGLDIADGALDTDSGDITLEGTATATTATAGVRVTGPGLTTNGGDITVTGTSAGGVGVQLGDGSAFAIGSGGGAITIAGTGIDAGVLMQGNQVASGGGLVSITGTGVTTGVSLDGSDIDSADGAIDITGTASGSGLGIDLNNARLTAGAGDIRLFGNATLGTGVNFTGQSGVSTTTGDIAITGIGEYIGLDITGGELTTGSGRIDLRGRGVAPGAIGLRIGDGVSVATNGGGIELSGQGNAAAGLVIGDRASVDAGNSLIVLRATSTNTPDSIDIRGSISSSAGVNLRPGGVDLQGELTEATADNIYLGGGSGGFVLSGTELALIETPELTIGSNLHAGAIQVLGGINREGNLTLQNGGGIGGIALQGPLNVGGGTLALSSAGSITQTSAGVITAHSLLAQAGGDVLLATALNDVANTTLAGTAGGNFEFQDANTLSIGSVSASGFDTSTGQMSSLAATGITAGGNVLVRNLQGDLTLNAGVRAANIDLVTAGRLQNPVGASLIASGDWRVWANTWVGETRGGLAGDGNLPNLYGCAYLGACGVTVSGADNHFIYVAQPTALVSFNNATREYGLPNPLFTFSVTGAILGDTAGNVASGTATTTATIGSDVGLYPILGTFLSAAGYRIQFAPGTLAITPAMLMFTADGAVRYLGFPNPDFTGNVTGFRNGDTVTSVFGNTAIWSSPAGPLSPIGTYAVNGGTSARNYVFTQAPGNAAALQIIPLPQLPSTPIEFIRETINTYVYDRNFGGAPVCAVNASLDDKGLAASGDGLSAEWTKVRARPNLTNCFDSDRENGCGSF